MVYGSYGICTVVLFMWAAADQSLQMPAPHSALAFMHVFKAGGTTFGVVLAKYAKANGIPFTLICGKAGNWNCRPIYLA